MILEFLSMLAESHQQEFLANMVHVLGHLANNLKESGSIYYKLLVTLKSLSPIKSIPLRTPAIRTMDEALEMFGPNPEGLEPMLTNTPQSVQQVQFYRHSNKVYK